MSNIRSFLLLFGCILIVVFIISLNNSGSTIKLSKDYVFSALTQYVENEYTDNSVFPDDAEVAISPLAFTYATNNAEKELKEIFETSEVKNTDVKTISGFKYIEYIANLFVANTDFQGKVSINKPPIDGYINIYFLKKDDRNLTEYFNGNCSFIGFYRAIICDSNFIKETMDDLGSVKKTFDIVLFTPEGQVDLSVDHESQKLIANHLMANFVTWILGHEIGHAVNHYDYLMNKVGAEALHFDLTYDEKEEEADYFVAKTILKSEGDASTFKTVLGEFIQQEYRRHFKKNGNSSLEHIDNMDNHNFPLENSLTIPVSKYRVPLLLRSLHVMDTLLELQPNLDSTGYYDALKEKITLEKKAF